MLKVLIDSNIYISAIGFGGKPKEILKLGLLGRFKIIITEMIISEVTEICHKKLGLSKSDLAPFFDELLNLSEIVTPNEICDETPNMADNKILAAAVEGNAECIVTGDKAHLLCLKEFKGIKIINPANFLEEYFDKSYH